MKNKLFLHIDSNYIVMFFRTFALVLIIITTYLICADLTENKSLIWALGILILALLASYSVILNIDTTIKLRNVENSNKIRFVFFHLCLIKMKLILLNKEKEKEKEKISYLDLDRILDTINEINIKLSEINTQDIVSIVHNNVLHDLHFIYLNINIESTFLKSFSKNIKRPEVGKENGDILPNPLNKISMKTDDSIKRLSSILIYLKEGYDKDFSGSGGIEECSGIN